MSYKIGDIFGEDEEYSERADFCNKNGYIIKEIESSGDNRRFQIQAPPAPTQEEVKERLRYRREAECFSIINRGEFWYKTLTEAQKTELNEWYKDWLNVTETFTMPNKPEWLK